jgi:two-component system phosphate regulon sensor histidine kinase PhoR
VSKRISFGIRGRLFALSLVVISVGLLGAYWYASRALDRDIAQRNEHDLSLRAKTITRALAALSERAVDACSMLNQLATASETRVTLIDPSGVVRCESAVSPSEIATMQNHNDRQEVVIARGSSSGTGSATRLSPTTHKTLVYFAQTLRRSDGQWVVRVAVERAVFAAEQETLKKILALAALLGLLVAAAMSSLASQLVTAPVRSLTDTARAMVSDLTVRARSTATDEVGQLAHALDELTDELVRSLASLRVERDRLATILESMVEGVLVTDAKGEILIANRAVRDMVGDRQRQTLAEKRLSTLNIPALQTAIETAGAKQSRESVEFKIDPTRTKVIAANVSPLSTASGEKTGCIAVLSDVTELRRLETMRRDFVANVSHELRTPIAAIRAATETLQDGGLDEPKVAKEFVDIIDRHADRLRRIVEDLLELSRIEANQRKLTPELLQARAVCEHTIELFALAAKTKKITLKLAEDSDNPTVALDRSAIEHVLGNLVDNALKYAPEGATVTLRAMELANKTRLVVEDNGHGIEARHLPRLFERFYRVDTSRSRDLGGTGLGLAIVKHTVEVMGGTVSVESEIGVGSKFYLDFYRKISDRPPIASAQT